MHRCTSGLIRLDPPRLQWLGRSGVKPDSHTTPSHKFYTGWKAASQMRAINPRHLTCWRVRSFQLACFIILTTKSFEKSSPAPNVSSLTYSALMSSRLAPWSSPARRQIFEGIANDFNVPDRFDKNLDRGSRRISANRQLAGSCRFHTAFPFIRGWAPEIESVIRQGVSAWRWRQISKS